MWDIYVFTVVRMIIFFGVFTVVPEKHTASIFMIEVAMLESAGIKWNLEDGKANLEA